MSFNDLWNDKELPGRIIMVGIIIFVIVMTVSLIVSACRRAKQKAKNVRDGMRFAGVPCATFFGSLQKDGLHLQIHNTAARDVLAVQWHIVAYNVYKEEVPELEQSLLINHRIAAGGSLDVFHPIEDPSVQFVQIYVYSIYYDDTSEWGCRDADDSVIYKKAYMLDFVKESS